MCGSRHAGQASARSPGLFPSSKSDWLPSQQSQDQGRREASVVCRVGGLSAPTPGGRCTGGPGTHCTHAAHRVSVSQPLARQVPQAASERPQNTGGALGPCVPTPLLLEALCDLLQMHEPLWPRRPPCRMVGTLYPGRPRVLAWAAWRLAAVAGADEEWAGPPPSLFPL